MEGTSAHVDRLAQAVEVEHSTTQFEYRTYR